MFTTCLQHAHRMSTTCSQHVHNRASNVLNVNLLRPSPGALRSNAVVKQPADRWWAPHAPVSKKRYARIIHMATEEKPGFPLNRGDGIGDPFAIERQTAGALPAHCESRDSAQDLILPRRATAMKFAEPSNAPVPESQPERTAFRPPAPKTPLRHPAMVQVKTIVDDFHNRLPPAAPRPAARKRSWRSPPSAPAAAASTRSWQRRAMPQCAGSLHGYG